MKKYEWDSIVDILFYNHFDNYIWFSLSAKDWKQYTFDYIVKNKYSKHSAIQALNSVIDNNRCTVEYFIECIDIAHYKQTPFGDAEIIFFESDDF